MSDLLSEALESYIEVLDHEDNEGADRETIEDWTRIERLVHLVLSSLEGFPPPKVDEVLPFFKKDAELWRWTVDNFYTRETISGVRGMVNRFLKLTPVLEGVVPSKEVKIYLREASRCFIYGFFQASIALSRAALEAGLNDHLGRELGAVPEVDLATKIDQAARLKLVSPDAASLAHPVRIAGREVLHRKPANENTAFDTLVQTRGFLMDLYEKRELRRKRREL